MYIRLGPLSPPIHAETYSLKGPLHKIFTKEESFFHYFVFLIRTEIASAVIQNVVPLQIKQTEPSLLGM
jgi:hypothetical protein